MHYVYIVECSDGTLYTGYTTDVDRRVGEHNAGEGAKYTRGRTPVRLVHTEEHETRSEAMSREAEIKGMSREEKEDLINLYTSG
jgi:putative endonuclease